MTPRNELQNVQKFLEALSDSLDRSLSTLDGGSLSQQLTIFSRVLCDSIWNAIEATEVEDDDDQRDG